ncbi:MAG: putative metallopeptidase [Planctomycetaceae bacterium]
MGRKGSKVKKRKKVTVRIIKEKHAGEITEPHRLLADIRRQYHAHLAEAKIGLAWRLGWRSDTDGHMRLGQCRKSSDLDREMYTGFDFVILLNEEAWPTLNEKQKLALLDHELCHAALSMDADGNPKINDRERLVCRTKKHDVEEFRCIVERHGLWTQDLESIARAAVNDKKRPLLNGGGNSSSGGNGSTSTSTPATYTNGVPVPAGTPIEGTAASNVDWRSWKTEVLGHYGLPAGKVKLLCEAGLGTLGKLMRSIQEAAEPGFWYKAIKGLGENGYDALTEAIAAMRQARPEFQADEK